LDFQAVARLHHDLPGDSDSQGAAPPHPDVPHCLPDDCSPARQDDCSRLRDDSPACQGGCYLVRWGDWPGLQVCSLRLDDSLVSQDGSALLRHPLPAHHHFRHVFGRGHHDSGFQPDWGGQHELFAPEAGQLSGSFQEQRADS
jgi:hypothetical protein